MRGLANPEVSAKPNRMLIDLGQHFLESEAFQLNGYAYKGSAAVHIFTHELLNQLDFVSQTDSLLLYKCPQNLASRGFDDLLGTMKSRYGQRRPKLRSGF